MKIQPVPRMALALTVAVAFAALACGCTQLGQLLGQKTTTPAENHSLQRISAQKFKSNWPATDLVRFTQEGSYSSTGQWAANAVVTLGGKQYQEIIGPWTGGGDDLPAPDALPATKGLIVTYSDGTSEALP